MWEAFIRPSHGVETVRSFFRFVAATCLVVVLLTTLLPTAAGAQGATRNGNSITYQGNTYTEASQATKDSLRMADGTTAYTYTDTSTTPPEMHVLFFASDVDSAASTSARYAVYTQGSSGTWSNTSPPTSVSIDQTNGGAAPTDGTTSCALTGVGWIVCPISNFLATSMDYVFDILSGYLVVRPVDNNQNSAMHRAWSVMRGFANIAFVLAFMMIIYSQLTNLGISNYGIKRLFPRIILAAILVNLSYLICTLAVDVSNILGFGFQNLFLDIRNTLVGVEGNTWDVLSWESITAAVLAGGAGLTVAGIAISSAVAGGVGAVALLLPALVSGILAVLVALAIMAARQALITVLIVVSPLAFVAYLLPNTEKWFDKWRSLFTTMLVLFPAFSVIFGGSQMAASIIIQNANSINVIILGMAVQVAPLFITPMLVRLSGSLLGKVAGLVNSPNRGLVDRTRKWSQERYDNNMARRRGTAARQGWRGIGQRHAQRLDHNRRRREAWRNVHENLADNRFAGSAEGHRLHKAKYSVELDKKGIEASMDAALKKEIQLSPTMLEREMKVRYRTDVARFEDSKLEQIHEEMRAGRAPVGAGAVMNALADRNAQVTRDTAISAMATQRAKDTQNTMFAQSVIRDEALQAAAGGIAKHGAITSLASVVNTMRSDEEKRVAEGRAVVKHFNPSGAERQAFALNGTSMDVEKDGVRRTITAEDTYIREAVIEDQVKIGTVQEVTDIIRKSGTDLAEFKTTISAAMATSGFGGKTIWGGGRTIDDVGQGNITSHNDLLRAAAEAVAKGKISAADLAQTDAAALQIFSEMAQDPGRYKDLIRSDSDKAKFDERLIKFSAAAVTALTSDERTKIKENADVEILKFARIAHPTFDPKDKSTWPTD